MGEAHNTRVDRAIKLIGHGGWLIAAAFVFHSIGYSRGEADGQRRGVDTVMCTMDRVTNSRPVGALGNSEFCQRIYRSKP